MTGLCTRCNKPLGKVARKTPDGLMHHDCWENEQADEATARLRADRDRLLAACKAAFEEATNDPMARLDQKQLSMLCEAIRLAEKEE